MFAGFQRVFTGSKYKNCAWVRADPSSPMARTPSRRSMLLCTMRAPNRSRFPTGTRTPEVPWISALRSFSETTVRLLMGSKAAINAQMTLPLFPVNYSSSLRSHGRFSSISAALWPGLPVKNGVDQCGQPRMASSMPLSNPRQRHDTMSERSPHCSLYCLCRSSPEYE